MKRRAWLRAAALAAAACTALAVTSERGDPSSKLSNAPDASESWDFSVQFDSNDRLFARFLITNEGPGGASAIAVGHFLHADGASVPFRNGRLAGRWTLGADGRSLRIGSSQLDLAGPGIALDIDNQKRGIKIHLRMQDARRARAGAELPGVSADVLALAARVEGSVWFSGMAEPRAVRGRAGISHTWMDQPESEFVLRRLDFFGSQDALAVYLGDAIGPGAQRAHTLWIERAGEPLLHATDFVVTHGEATTSVLGSDYPIPSQIEIEGSEFSGSIHLEGMLLRHEPLQDLPQPFRFLLSLRSRPQRVWMNSQFEVRFKPVSALTPLQVRGSGITSVTFNNPLPSAKSNRHLFD